MSEQSRDPMRTTESSAAMHELLERNRKRRSVRRWIGIGSIPVLIVAAVLVVKLLSMYAFAHQSIRSFVSMDFGTSVAMAKWQGPLNWFEPYKAGYNLGTGLAELGELDNARTALERALPLAPGLESCAVRYNLATVIERQGDRATAEDDGEQGQALYREALELLAASPEGCVDQRADEASPDRKRSMHESLSELTRRIMEKLKQQNEQQNQNPNGENNPEGAEPPPEQQRPNDSQLEELKKKLQSGTEERQQRDQGQSGGSGGGTDRPW